MLLILKLLSDFGLFLLIWLVQMIIYPSFSYYAEGDLLIWHKKYTRLITYFVLPLMVIQLVTTSLLLYKELSWLTGIQLLAIVSIWLSTFLQAVPLHNNISEGTDALQSARQLVAVNWLRTILWSLVFVLSFFSLAGELI